MNGTTRQGAVHSRLRQLDDGRSAGTTAATASAAVSVDVVAPKTTAAHAVKTDSAADSSAVVSAADDPNVTKDVAVASAVDTKVDAARLRCQDRVRDDDAGIRTGRPANRRRQRTPRLAPVPVFPTGPGRGARVVFPEGDWPRGRLSIGRPIPGHLLGAAGGRWVAACSSCSRTGSGRPISAVVIRRTRESCARASQSRSSSSSLV